jgi:hypothetical protein
MEGGSSNLILGSQKVNGLWRNMDKSLGSDYCRLDRLCGLVVRVLGTDPEARVRFPALPEKKSSGSGTGSTQLREYN